MAYELPEYLGSYHINDQRLQSPITLTHLWQLAQIMIDPNFLHDLCCTASLHCIYRLIKLQYLF